MKEINKFLKDYREEIRRSALEMLPLAMPDVTEELFGEFERTGERLGYERVYFTRRKYLTITGMEAILLIKEKRDRQENCRKEPGAEEKESELYAGKGETGNETGCCTVGEERNETDCCTVGEEGNETGCCTVGEEGNETGCCTGDEEGNETGCCTVGEEGNETDCCTRNEEIIRKLCAVIESVCEEETWALPAHVDRKAENWQSTVDLFASETAQTLANLMDELWEELPETLILRMQEEICRRVLNPFFKSEVPYSWWEGSEMNWNAVCAGAIGSACIHFRNRGLALPADFSACISRVCSSLTHYIDGFSDDGVCMEGLGYYTYGMAFFVNFMRELEEVSQTADKHNQDQSKFIVDRLLPDVWRSEAACPASDSLESDVTKSNRWKEAGLKTSGGGKCSEKLRRIAEFPGKCFFLDGRSVSFSDGDSRDTWRVGIWCALSSWFDDLPLPNLKSAAGVHADSCYRFVNLKMDVFETEKYLGREEENEKTRRNCREPDVAKKQEVGDSENGDSAYRRTEQSDRSHGRVDILPDAQWCIAESRNGVGFACKGGHNDEPHNHNDIGHFIYESGGTVFLADLGAGEYTADYFGAKRYQILCNSSAGHSVPVLNTENQRCGREYRCGEFAAYIDETNRSRKIFCVQMEIGSAWSGKEGVPAPSAGVQRTFRFDLQNGKLEIEDVFDRTQWGTVTETLITQRPPLVAENHAYLWGDRGSVAITVWNAGNKKRKSEYLNRDEISGKAGSPDMKMEEETPHILVRELEHRNHAGEAETVYAICWDVSGDRTRIRLRYFSD